MRYRLQRWFAVDREEVAVRRALLCVVISVVGLSAIVLPALTTGQVRLVLGDLLGLPVQLLAVGSAAFAAFTGRQRRARWAWGLIAAAAAVFMLGDLIWVWLELVRSIDPFPSAADAAYLAFYPLAFAGLLMMPVRARRAGELQTRWLDAATVAIAGAMGVWSLVVGPSLEGYTGSRFAAFLASAYPVGDLLLLFGVASVFLRHPMRRMRIALIVLTVGFTAMAVGDLMFVRTVLSDATSTVALSDASWIVAMVCIAGAANVARWHQEELDRVRPRGVSALPASRLPYVAVVLAYVFALRTEALRNGPQATALFLGIAAITLLVALRQTAVQRQNAILAAELDHLATTDVLTGLPNRRGFFDRGAELTQRAARSDKPIAALMIDLDRFKLINDTYGHRIGDEVLQIVAVRAGIALRASDLLGRLGGDEFSVILTEADAETAHAIAGRLRLCVTAQPAITDVGPIQLDLSVGVSTRQPAETLDELLARADVALYEAKRARLHRDLEALQHARADTSRSPGTDGDPADS